VEEWSKIFMKRFVLLFLTVCILIPSFAYGQTQKADPSNEQPKPLTFDVASVKPTKSDDGIAGIIPSPTGFSARRVLIMQLIMFAYRNINGYQSDQGIILPKQIVGLPGWTMKERYDIDAKLPPEILSSFQNLRAEQQREILQPMLASLLTERFKLKFHYKSTDEELYSLILKNASKLNALSHATNPCSMKWGSNYLDFHDCSIDLLAWNLSFNEDIGRIVVNRTGQTGVYEFHLHWTPLGNEDSENAPSLFSALEEQLGLKLVSTKGKVNTLVVDSIEKPSPN
jgi:uncharacterized protein (TIGR03435 family)